MNLTYWELKENIWFIAKKHWFIEDDNSENDEICFMDDKEDEEIKMLKQRFLENIDDIIINSITKELPWEIKLSDSDFEVSVNKTTNLNKKCLFDIYSTINQEHLEYIIFSLTYNFLNWYESSVFDTLIEAYNMEWNDEVYFYTESRNLIEKFEEWSVMHKLVSMILEKKDFIYSLKFILKEFWINVEYDKNIGNKIVPQEITELLSEINCLLLSKLWIHSFDETENLTGLKTYH